MFPRSHRSAPIRDLQVKLIIGLALDETGCPVGGLRRERYGSGLADATETFDEKGTVRS
jgi:hypothetical protein